MTDTRRAIAVSAALVALCLPLAGFIVDDAYINFRYSRNLWAGDGLVYNLGERVEGYTNFLWVVLLAPFSNSDAAISWAATLLGLLAAAGSVWTLFLFPRALGTAEQAPTSSWIAPFITATSLTTIVYAVAGLETALFGFLVLRGLYAVFVEKKQERFGWSSLWFLAAALARPEGCLFFAFAALYRVIGDHRAALKSAAAWRWVAVFVVPGAVYFAWRWSYFGELLPNTFAAKTGDFPTTAARGTKYVRSYLERTFPLTGALFVLAPLAWATRRPARDFLIAVSAMVVVFTGYIVSVGGDWMTESRFFYPVVPLWALLCQEGVRQLLVRAVPEGRRRRVGVLALTAIVAVQLIAYGGRVSIVRKKYQGWERKARVGTWLAANGVEPASLSLGDIGQIGWKTDYRIVDMLGLVTKEVSELPGSYTRKDPEKTAEHILAERPEYVLVIGRGPTKNHRPNTKFGMQKALVKRQEFRKQYVTFLDHRITDKHYWVVLRNRETTPAIRLGDDVPGDFETRFAGWQSTGSAFGKRPSAVDELDEDKRMWGMEGRHCAASNQGATGQLESSPFEIAGGSLRFIVATSAESKELRVELVIGDRVVLSANGDGTYQPDFVEWDVSAWRGQQATIRLIDNDDTKGAFLAADMFRQVGAD